MTGWRKKQIDDAMAGDGGYEIGTQEGYDAFVKVRNQSLVKMRIKELLESIPSFGSTRAENILDQIGISHTRRIRGIGVRQKNELLKALERR